MKKVLLYALLLVFLAIVVVGFIYYPRLDLITGFAAKNMCSCTFLAERDPASVTAGDNDFSPVSLAKAEVDYEERSATATVFGLKERKAIYTEGLGCTLLPEDADRNDRSIQKPERTLNSSETAYPFGRGEALPPNFSEVNSEKIQEAVDFAFAPNHRTRAVLVLYRDRLLAEQYAPGFTAETKQLGWSMTKSITNAVLGILERQGKISLEQDHLFPEWENDERAQITLNDLLQMNSALEWDENYNKISDVTKMLFLAEDMSEVQLEKPLAGEPGNLWNYSSGTSNLLSGFIRDQFNDHREYLDFWYRELIDRIGMHSMIVETDMAGNFVGSSYGWATPRDWAKFGLLYLHRGNWNGEQILNESWVDYSAAPTKGSDGQYGAHFWLNAGGLYPNVPKDLYSANGFQGQHVFIIPSRDLVVVRFGLIEYPEFDIDTFLKQVVNAIEPVEAELAVEGL